MVYHVGAPLDTIFTPPAMMAYTRIFKLLWDIKHVEHALAGAWHTAKPNNRLNRAVRGGASAAAALAVDLRTCMCLRSEMSNFITNLQYYFVFEVLEGTRDGFIKGKATRHCPSSCPLIDPVPPTSLILCLSSCPLVDPVPPTVPLLCLSSCPLIDPVPLASLVLCL